MLLFPSTLRDAAIRLSSKFYFELPWGIWVRTRIYSLALIVCWAYPFAISDRVEPTWRWACGPGF